MELKFHIGQIDLSFLHFQLILLFAIPQSQLFFQKKELLIYMIAEMSLNIHVPNIPNLVREIAF